MQSRYNLRRRKQKMHYNYSCREPVMQNSQTNYNLRVKLDRCAILDDPNNVSDIFYIKDNTIQLKYTDNKKFFNGRKMFTLFFGLLFFVILLYLIGNGNTHSVQSYLLSLRSFSENVFSKTFNNNVREPKHDSVFIMNENVVGSVKNIEIDVREIVQDHFREMAKNNEDTKVKPNTFPNKDFVEQHNSVCDIDFMHCDVYENSSDQDEMYFNFYPFTDYALASQGAKVLSIYDTEPYGSLILQIWNQEFSLINYFFTNFLYVNFHANGPTLVLKPWIKPGDCWAFKGEKSKILLELSENITVTAVTIDHIRDYTYQNNSGNSAPKKFSVFGVLERNNPESRILLGTFEYRISGPELQTFLVFPSVELTFKMVQFNFESNHGNDYYTCIYKIRVHGYPL